MRHTKQKLRLHYAGLVRQIDHEVGEILATLDAQNLRDNTVIIFVSDHGDYLGDHDFIGKGSFFEGSIRIPLIVAHPDMVKATSCSDLVMLTDVAATLLTLAGVAVPAYMDALALPALSLTDRPSRDHIFGMTSDGWMSYDGRYRLHKYATGESLLFDIANDPSEQHNLIDNPAYHAVYRQLEQELTEEIMRSMRDAFRPNRVYDEAESMWCNQAFGARGWRRRYPCQHEK